MCKYKIMIKRRKSTGHNKNVEVEPIEQAYCKIDKQLCVEELGIECPVKEVKTQ